jgi:hypothetical protein
MWKIGPVQTVNMPGVDGLSSSWGFNVTNDEDNPLVGFAYENQSEAEAAVTQIRSVIEKAISVFPYPQHVGWPPTSR